MTFTRTHVYITFACPYLVCTRCRASVTGMHSQVQCGCDAAWANMPCAHDAGIDCVCPSWSPVDGCRCVEHLGRKTHSEPPISAEREDTT